MSWIQKLYETYEACTGNESIPDAEELCPIGYSVQNAHIEVVIDGQGNFRRASLVDSKDAKTLIPVTEKSLTGRTSGIAPHSLCDSLQYCAGDHSRYTGDRESYFDQCRFTDREFTDRNLNPITLINLILKETQETEKKSLSKQKCIRWLNLLLVLANTERFPDMQTRIHYNRVVLEKKYPDNCPPNSSSYLLQLERWNRSSASHKKVKAIYTYVSKQAVIGDLIQHNLLTVKDGKLSIVVKTDEKEKVRVISSSTDDNSPVIMDSKELHPIFKLLIADDKGVKSQSKVFVRWKVESNDSLCSETWKDQTLFEKWAEYLGTLDSIKGFCYVTGEKETDIAQKHPAKLRNGRDGAKLISSNDMSGFTFLGRFKSVYEAASVSTIVTQKAHSALRWLIGRKQAFRSGDQVFVSWATTGKPIPDPCANSLDFLGDEFETSDDQTSQVGDVGQAFVLRFNKKLAGYKANITDTEDIVVMGLDSATPGRMAITFYRELTGSEFLERIEKWHTDFAWLQDFGTKRDKDTKKKTRIIFEGAPAPKDIAWCAYGKRLGEKGELKVDTKLLNATVERLMPSIIDGKPVPRDLVEQCVRRASNRVGLEPWEFEKCLGIACSLYKGFHKERGYIMALEEERDSRDYLYGRLLAVADQIELMALQLTNENRGTTASRLMQRFSDRPFSTWKNIEEALKPYKDRIRVRYRGLLDGYDELLDVIHSRILSANYIKDTRLTGEYLLGYHCQRQWFHEHKREQGQWVLKLAADMKNQQTDFEE
ncbi:MAG: CRISPR-associated protein (Cas_Csd1) [Syntrophorhabdus sp. PtaU1.Bin002]|nr:MAG: CRISPR-associated protein (Cas_Csd1) [Syntrophorhabdus sp. PtaU1.Bin002]